MPSKKNTAKKTSKIGGFVAANKGIIDNCYSIVKFKRTKITTGGFVGKNLGQIKNSFYSFRKKKIKHVNAGISGGGWGSSESTYFFHKEKKESKRLEKLLDPLLGVRIDDIKDAENVHEYIVKLGFDTENIWEYTDNPQILQFIPDKWMYDVKNSALYSRYLPEDEEETEENVNYISIRKADELFELAERINEGDTELAFAYIKLEGDINLGGKEWIPIGEDSDNAFYGLFDGGGYRISNFVIKDKSVKVKGFFGHLKGEVYNLTVDCNIKEKQDSTTAGGIAAICGKTGVIGCCASIIEIRCENKENNGNFGGLVGSNNGMIFQSYSAGRVRIFIIPWWWGVPVVPLILLLFMLLFPNAVPFDTPFDTPPVFPPPPADTGAVRLPGPIDPVTGTNFVSFEFEQEIEVNLATGECRFHFRNPGESNHDIVVQLQMTDAEAVRAKGSTGRLPEEQARLESNPEYDPELNSRIILAESGAIPVGYMLDYLILSDQPNGATLAPGVYPAIVFLIFFDRNTHSRAMLESQLPVTLNVG